MGANVSLLEHLVRRTRVLTVPHTHRRAIRYSRPAQTLLVGISAGGDGKCNSGGPLKPPVNTTMRKGKLGESIIFHPTTERPFLVSYLLTMLPF